MGALKKVKFYRLPPAGNRVPWSAPVEEDALRGLFAPWKIATFGSGTEALAAALLALKARLHGRNEVILSAYNCPALVSAIQYTGCAPRLVDLVPGRPWVDLEAVSRALSPRTLAILAVDLFGIPERYAALRELATAGGCGLVQDSAQGFPKRAGDVTWRGDLVILSFGRGKPVTLLGGGAVVFRDAAFAAALDGTFDGAYRMDERNHARRVWAYHWLRSPRLYWLPAALPMLHLGETRYERLVSVRPMPAFLKNRIPAAVSAYRALEPNVQTRFSSAGFEGRFVDLPRACGVKSAVALSRYPLLAPDVTTRERLYADLERFGVSRMYGAILPEVAGLEEAFQERQRLPNARDFADRLFTLPTHDGVRAQDVSAIVHRLQPSPPSPSPIRELTG